jgi:hypothetical protein
MMVCKEVDHNYFKAVGDFMCAANVRFKVDTLRLPSKKARKKESKTGVLKVSSGAGGHLCTTLARKACGGL